MIWGVFKSQDDLIDHILFSYYYIIYLIFSESVFQKQPSIGTVFLPTVIIIDLVGISVHLIKWCKHNRASDQDKLL